MPAGRTARGGFIPNSYLFRLWVANAEGQVTASAVHDEREKSRCDNARLSRQLVLSTKPVLKIMSVVHPALHVELMRPFPGGLLVDAGIGFDGQRRLSFRILRHHILLMICWHEINLLTQCSQLGLLQIELARAKRIP